MSLASRAQQLKGDWQFESQRQEIAPVASVDKNQLFEGKPTMVLQGGGKDHAAGYWYRIVPAVAGDYYHFKTHFKSHNVDEPARSILARVLWEDVDGKIVGFREYT